MLTPDEIKIHEKIAWILWRHGRTIGADMADQLAALIMAEILGKIPALKEKP